MSSQTVAPRLTLAVQDYIFSPEWRKMSTAEEYAEMEKGRCKNGMDMLDIKAPRAFLRGKPYTHTERLRFEAGGAATAGANCQHALHLPF